MAEVMNSLFGFTPEALQMQREKQAQQEALSFAQLQDPFARANYQIYQGASGLGRQLGGLFGLEDPEMQRIQQRQGMLQNIDLSNPESLKQGIQQAMQNKDYQLVSELTNRYQQSAASALAARKTESEILKNEREKVGADPFQQLLRTGKYTVASLGNYQQSGNIADLVPVDPNEPTQITQTAEGIVLVNKTTGEVVKRIGGAPADNFGAEAERYSRQFYNKPYSSLSQPEMARVNAKVEETAKERGTKIVLPGQQVPQKEWLPFAEYLDKNPLVKKTTDLISAAPAALATIRMSTSNDIASTALAPQLARMAGETGALSANDVNRWAKSGGLDDRLIGSATSFFTGKTTVAKKEQAEKYVSAVFRGALLEQKRTLQDKAIEFGYLESPNYKARLESIDAQLARFKKPSENKPVDSTVRVQPTGNPLIDKYLTPQ